MSSKKIEGVIRGDRRVVTNPGLIRVIPGFNCRTSLGDLTEMKATVKEHGVLSAVWVRPDPGNEKQPYILIAGERRLTCAKQLWDEGVRDVRIPIEVFNVDDNGAEDLMAIENLERQNLTFEDEANLVSRWYNRKFSIDEISAKVQKSRTWVEQRLTLASASPTLKAQVASGEVPLRVGVQVAASTPVEAQNDVLTKIKEKSGGKRSAMQKAAGEVLGVKGRPGKKDVNRVIKQINTQAIPSKDVPAEEVRMLVVAAMQFAVGDMPQGQFLSQWTTNLPDVPPPEEVATQPADEANDKATDEADDTQTADEIRTAVLDAEPPPARVPSAPVTPMTAEESAALKALIDEGF